MYQILKKQSASGQKRFANQGLENFNLKTIKIAALECHNLEGNLDKIIKIKLTVGRLRNQPELIKSEDSKNFAV